MVIDRPPMWLRHIVPWRVLTKIDVWFNVCWAQVVMWKLYGDTELWSVTSTCFGSEPPYDYCGKFETEPWCERRCLVKTKRSAPATEVAADSAWAKE